MVNCVFFSDLINLIFHRISLMNFLLAVCMSQDIGEATSFLLSDKIIYKALIDLTKDVYLSKILFY